MSLHGGSNLRRCERNLQVLKKLRFTSILRGARQVGKKFGELEYPAFHYFNFAREPGLNSFFDPDLDPQKISW